MSNCMTCTTPSFLDDSITILANHTVGLFSIQSYINSYKAISAIHNLTKTIRTEKVFSDNSKTESQIFMSYEVKKKSSSINRDVLFSIFGDMVYFSVEEEKRATELFESRCDVLPINLMDL